MINSSKKKRSSWKAAPDVHILNMPFKTFCYFLNGQTETVGPRKIFYFTSIGYFFVTIQSPAGVDSNDNWFFEFLMVA